MEVTNQYNAHLDAKKRLTLRGASFQYYNVKKHANGCIVLEPRQLTKPKSISARTLKAMDQAVRNFKVEEVSEPVDLSDF